MNIKSIFGKLKDGREVIKYHLKNDKLEVNILNYGGIITEIYQKDRDGRKENIVLGFDNIEDYEERSPHFGCITGRVAGRLAKGRLPIDGKVYTLPVNNGENSLHGGISGLDKKIWDVREIENGIELSYVSEHMEEGYPGEVKFTVRYILSEGDLLVKYYGETNQKTFVNLTNHTYFNLSAGKDKILDHKLYIDSDVFMELGEGSIPTGILKKVDGTVFDRRQGDNLRKITEEQNKDIEVAGGGIDHPFVLNKKNKTEIVLRDEESGRRVEIETSEPTVVVYTGNFLGEEGGLSWGRKSEVHLGVCLETQDYPDSPNQPGIKTNFITPDKPYSAWTKYSFSID